MTTKTKRWLCAFGALCVAILLMGCASNGPISGPTTAVVGGIGGVAIAILDQLFASGVLEPHQYQGLANGIANLANAATSAAAGVDEVRRGLGDLQESAITTTEVLTYGGGAALLGGGVGAGRKMAAKKAG